MPTKGGGMAGARGRRTGPRSERERRQAQLEEISSIVTKSSARVAELRKDQRQCGLLHSVADGLYHEVDKLSKKAAAEDVTQLVLDEVNHLVGQVKALGRDDAFIQRLKEFVPAGQMPEQRDVVVVLKLALQGLDRVAESLTASIQRESARNREARQVKWALDYYVDNNEVPTKGDFEEFGEEEPEGWITGYPEQAFDFERLDRLNLDIYFARHLDASNDEDDSEDD